MKNENSNYEMQTTSNDIRELSVAELEQIGGGVRPAVDGYIGLPIRPQTSVD
jgi:hypothetical protein